MWRSWNFVNHKLNKKILRPVKNCNFRCGFRWRVVCVTVALIIVTIVIFKTTNINVQLLRRNKSTDTVRIATRSGSVKRTTPRGRPVQSRTVQSRTVQSWWREDVAAEIPSSILKKIKWAPYFMPVGECPRTCAHRITPTAPAPDLRTRAVQLPELQTPPKTKHRVFMPLLSTQEKLSLLHLLDVLVEILEDLKIDYFLDRGSLLGVLRHRGMIPWDDDVDVSVSVSHWARLKEALCCTDGLSVLLDKEMHWKVFHNDSFRVTNWPEIRFPYIDIFFYDEDDTYMWSFRRKYRQNGLTEKSNVFPLTTAYFEGKEYKVPRLYKKSIFAVDFGNLSYCQSPGMHHRVHTFYRVTRLKCTELSYMYTFYITSQGKLVEEPGPGITEQGGRGRKKEKKKTEEGGEQKVVGGEKKIEGGDFFQ